MSDEGLEELRKNTQEHISELEAYIVKYDVIQKDVTYITSRLHQIVSVYYKLLDEIETIKKASKVV